MYACGLHAWPERCAGRLLLDQATAVKGGGAGRGCRQKVDISLWSDSVDAMAQCLRHPDVGDQRSPSYKRLRSIDLLCVEVFRLKVRVHSVPRRVLLPRSSARQWTSLW